jgi:hypothetical protein
MELAQGREPWQEQQAWQRRGQKALRARQQRVSAVLVAPRPAFQEVSWFPIEPSPRK